MNNGNNNNYDNNLCINNWKAKQLFVWMQKLQQIQLRQSKQNQQNKKEAEGEAEAL